MFSDHNALMIMTQMKEKQDYLYQHAINCAVLMTVFARYMNFDQEVIQNLATGALLHDVGMLHIPEKILTKPGDLADGEQEKIKHHVSFSSEIACSMPGISSEALDVIKYHHERLDGSGYPQGLSGDDISIYGRMSALVDSYNAMTSDRIYKDAVSSVTAFKIMKTASQALTI